MTKDRKVFSDASAEVRRANGYLARLDLLVPLILVLCLSGLVAMLMINRQVARQYFPVLQTLAAMESDLAAGHLWFEEILGGDRQESFQDVSRHWERALGNAQALVRGGRVDLGVIDPLPDAADRALVAGVLDRVTHLKAAAEARMGDRANAQAGSPADQDFDRLFRSIFTDVRTLREDISDRVVRHARLARRLQWGMLAGFLLLTVFLWLLFARNRRRELEARQLLEQSERRFRLMIDTAAEGILVADLELGKFTYANGAICDMLGYSREQLLSLGVQDIHPPEVQERVQDQFARLKVGGLQPTPELPVLHRDGHVLVADVNASLLELDGRLHAVGLFTDRTAELATRREKEKLEDQLRHAQKMEAVGNLAGGIAHDFNNLLQAILGYAELLREGNACPPEVQEDVDKIHQAADRAATLTSQLLAFSRRQVIAPVDLDLNLVIPDLLKMVERLIGENISLRFFPGHNLGLVCLDKSQLEQILMNLCLNARDAMGVSGRLTIETENVKVEEDFCRSHAWAKPGRYVLLSVTDTGVGMSAETLEKVFEPFFTTKEVGKGTGLGLATVYGIVRQNGGMIHAYSEVGSGSTFKIYLPLVQRSAAKVGTKLPREIKGGSETVLVAEDDSWVRELAVRILEEAGYRVLTATDGPRALTVFQEHRDEVDLALLDVVMPGLGGRQVQEAIHETRSEVKVLFASGYSQNAIHTDFVLDEGRLLIAKPYAREELLRKVREALDS